ncbi:MAG: hypothetical protein HXN09_04950 [Porphyromonadaceae bacterium]|nr:hypothetical protein [Porphyromonadaceae bacterium]
MKTTRLVWGLMVVLSAISSCRKEQDVFGPSVDVHGGSGQESVDLLVFQNKEQLELAVKQGKGIDSRGRSLAHPADQLKSNQPRTLSGDSISSLSYSVMVPETAFRKLLNERGEIQVGDTIYCITPAGTFYAPKTALLELRAVAKDYKPGAGEPVREHLFKVGQVYLYETFANAEFSEDDVDVPDSQEEVGDNEARSIGPVLAGNIPLPDLNSFPKERGRRITWAGKIFQSISVRKSHVATFPANPRRRVNCAVYDFNYLVYHSIGITAKVQKKMFYPGWAKMKYWPKNTILVGYRYALVKYPYPDNMYNRLKEAFAKIPHSSPNTLYAASQSEYLSRLPYPSWFKTELINLTEPILGLFKAKLTYQDVLSLAGDQIKSLIRSQAGASWESQRYADHDIFTSKKDKVELERTIQTLKMDDFVPGAVPIYAQDGIYIFYSGGWMTNRQEDQPEVDFKLDGGYGNFMLTYNGSLTNAGFDFSKPYFKPNLSFNFQTFTPSMGGANMGAGNMNLSITSDRGAGTLIGGDFFAVAYNGSWEGYNLSW